ncbi:OmpA family protein [Nitrosococcus watsonii]|nr:OmpA family protein [Nitrosococcus watsonii]
MNKKIMAIMAIFTPLLLTAYTSALADDHPLYAPYKGWPPCAVMTGEGETDRLGRSVTGVICRSTLFVPDSDKDGVSDDKDQCPDTPPGVEVDEVGCPLDSDNDGVPDYLDQCPDTPPGVAVNNEGCPVDSDGDGVPDDLDECPDTAHGVSVDEVGCPKPVVLQSGVHFGFDSAKLSPNAHTILDKVAEKMRAHPNLKVTITGYTDSIGNADYNMRLSKLRAEAAMDYLSSEGIDPSRMEAVGRGEERPVASNSTKEGRAKNRRVELQTHE